MDDFRTAASVLLGSFAVFIGWKKLGKSRRPRSRPTRRTADTADTADYHPPVITVTTTAPPVTHTCTIRPSPAVGGKAKQHIREACQIHERWSIANDTHVACFDLFTILGTDQASFCAGDASSFAAVVRPSMEDQSPSGEVKTRVMMRAWDYLSDAERYGSYTTALTPLIAEQRQDMGLDCAAEPPAQPPGPGGMSEICGW